MKLLKRCARSKAALRSLLGLFAFVSLLLAQTALNDRISINALRGYVSFLASDVLKGRGTPSAGLDAAAHYIADEFRRAGLTSFPDDGYFQNADLTEVLDHPGTQRFSLSATGVDPREVSPARITVLSLHGADLVDEPVFKWTPNVRVDGSLAGKILILRTPTDASVIRNLAFAKPDAIVELDRDERAVETPHLPRFVASGKAIDAGPNVIALPELEVEAIFARLHNGATDARASLRIDAPDTQIAHLQNIVGVLRGSDPVLQNQIILISAHYDHLGVVTGKGNEVIYNGANDNASGVATVIELARAFALENPRPKRTLVFLCFFGEEEGLLGSQYYVKHPLFPLADTVANINFEQLGRPETEEGLHEGSLGVTGSEYSSLPQMLGRAAKPAGVTIRKTREENGFFDRSDNYSFALAGIPAHTFLAAFEFPDYHQPSDKWQKLDFDNMARLDRGLALGILDLANRDDTPRWNESNHTAKDFAAAWHALHH